MKKYICTICETDFTVKSNLSRHQKLICFPKEQYRIEYESMKKNINDLKNELKIYEKEHTKTLQDNIILTKEVEHLKKTVEELLPFKNDYIMILKKTYESNCKMMEQTHNINNKIMEINSETTKINAEASIKSLSTAKYISKHLTQAPPLTYDKKEISGLLEYNSSKRYKPVDYVIYNYTLKKLDEWVGNIIVKIYKKENPFDQSIWVTDNSRFSYLIFDVIEDASGKKHEWITDKIGTKITEKIIAPTLNLLSIMLETYLEETKYIHEKYDNMELEEISRYSNNRQKAVELIKEIKEDILHKNVLKYITPLFNADPVKIEDAIIKVNKKDKII